MLLLEKVFKVINDSGLDYCIQNKYEMMPENIPSDIDMMYRNATEKDLDDIVLNVAKQTDLLITQKIVQSHYEFTYILSYKKPEDFFQLQLDFYKTVSFGKYWNVVPGSELLDNKRFYKCFYVPNYYDELRYLWIRRTIKNKIDESYIEQSLFLMSKVPNYESKLESAFGKEMTKCILNICQSRDVTLFFDNYREFENQVMAISKKNQKSFFWISHIKFKIFSYIPKRIFKLCGMSVTFLAPDGAGKSTIIRGINKTCSGSFYGIENKYFRPRLFSNLGSYKIINPTSEAKTNEDPHGKEKHGFVKSFIRFMFYNLDFLFGGLIIVNKLKAEKKLIVFDRYYYDYFVDIARYQYNLPECFVRFFEFMIPNPDLVFVLDADPQVMYERKQELPLKELQRQRGKYQRVAKMVKNVQFLDANQNAECVIEEATKKLLLKQAERTTRIIKNAVLDNEGHYL